MDNTEKISLGGVLTREQFLLPEMRIVAALRLDGVSDDEIIARVKHDNLFQYPTERMLADRARVCLRRFDAVALDEAQCAARGIDKDTADQAVTRIMELVANGMPDQAAQANLIAMMCRYTMVRELIQVEIGERMASFDYNFTDVDLNAFVTRFQVEHAEAVKWSESTLERIKSTLRQILRSAGFKASQRTDTLQPLLLDPDVEQAIRDLGDMDALAALTGQVM